MKREDMLERILERPASEPWDIAIIGGGATGVGVAIDAASRGYSAILLERSDFGKGTSSRSTKLVHGGVRYLEQGNIPLVMRALKERGILRRNAPHIVTDLEFVVPTYDWWEGPFYGVGLRVYDLLAGKYGFGPSRNLSRSETLERIPTLKTDGLRGGVSYYDGQFDDSRLLINMVQTAAAHGAVLANYLGVTSLLRAPEGLVRGLLARDAETGEELRIDAKVVVNATGPFSDDVRKMADAAADPMISPSQGVHVVLDRSFLPGDSAIMVPHTDDGRVMFAIPWHGHVLVGTTDTPLTSAAEEPRPTSEEIDFILTTVAQYLQRPPDRADVLSAFAGVRPLVGRSAAAGSSTKSISRDHTVHVDPSQLLTIAGGKWTTYRHMAEDCVDHAAMLAELDERECVTRDLPIHGACEDASAHGRLAPYGSDAPAIEELAKGNPSLGAQLHPALPYTGAEVVWAVRHEMARTVEDVLARRTRALFLNARAALEMAPGAAAIMARELGRDDAWQHEQIAAFQQVAQGFLAQPF
jgi:glycerol-3-phosphate dehydrogenase